MSVFNTKVGLPQSTAEWLSTLNLQSGGRVQQAIDKAVIDWDLQYVPFRTGLLGHNAYSATTIGSGQVVYAGPYAHYQYYGEVYGPNILIFEDNSGEPTRWVSPKGQKKHPTGKPLTYDQSNNPLAGSYWFERMKADHLNDIIGEAKKAVGK